MSGLSDVGHCGMTIQSFSLVPGGSTHMVFTVSMCGSKLQPDEQDIRALVMQMI